MLKAAAAEGTVASCSAVPVNGKTENMIPAIYKAFNPADAESVGRVIRQTNAELTVRNEAFHDYLFSNNLYNANGALDVFFASQANMLLVRVPDADAAFQRMKQAGVLVKNVSKMHPLLTNCLRLTVGTPSENASLIRALQTTP